jgi:Na+-driven multidrug efflux pump
MKSYIRGTFRVTVPLVLLSLIYLAAMLLITPAAFPKYVDAMPYFLVLWIGYAWTILGNPLTILVLSINRADAAMYISLGQLALTVVSHYLFITRLGAMGAAVSTVLMWFLAGTVSLWYLYVNRREIEKLPV